MRAENADGTAGLHQQRFIVGQALQFAHDGMERWPIAGGFACAAVDHQVARPLGDIRVEVIHEHAQSGFLLPSPAAQGCAAGCADDWGHAVIVTRCVNAWPGWLLRITANSEVLRHSPLPSKMRSCESG